jgi:hypothetical protein
MSKFHPNKSLGYYELKKHKPRLNEGCAELGNQTTNQTAVVTGSK